MKNLPSFLSIYLFSNLLLAQPTIQWQKSLGGSASEEATSIQQTSDGGYIVTGYTSSFDGDVSGTHGIYDFWVVKLSSSGSLQWKKALGGSDLDWPNAIRQAQDGGYIVAGYTKSNDGDVSGNHGDKDAWVVKLSSTGTIEWQKALGGSGWDEARSIEPTVDGGYIMAGQSDSSDGDASGSHGGSLDCWVVKLGSTGIIQWQKAIGGSGEDIAHSIKQTADGGYIMAGETGSNDGDISGNNGDIDFWVAKLNSLGNMEWQKALGGGGSDIATDIHQTANGFIVSGYEGSINSGDVTNHHGLFDYWIVKLNSSGELLQQNSIGGSDADWGDSGWPLEDGGYIIAGSTQSTNGDVTNNTGGQNIWVVKLNDFGEIVWQKSLGGSQAESCNSVWLTSDGGLVLAGKSKSNNGDVSGNHGGADFWVVKLSPESVSTNEAPNAQSVAMEIFPNPAQQSISIKTTSEESTLNVTISDLLGRGQLRQSIQNGGNVDVSSLLNGLYIVVVTEPSGRVFTSKLRKE